MTASDLSALLSRNNGKLAKRHLEDLDGEPEKKRSKKVIKAPIVVDPIYKPSKTNFADIKVTSKSLQGKVIVVEPSKDHNLKKNLEEIVLQHNGTVEQNPAEGITWAYIQTGK